MATLQKRGAKWRALVRRQGRSYSGTFNSKPAAAAWAKRVEDDLASGKLGKSSEVAELTFRDAAERRIEREQPSESTEARLRWWIERLGHRKLCEISRHDIERGLDELRRTPKLVPRAHGRPVAGDGLRSPATLNRYLRVVSATLEDFVDPEEGLPHNPARRVKRNPEPSVASRYFTKDEIERLLQACKASAYPRLYFLATSALVTGARRGELLELTWDRVDVVRGEAYLRPQDTKTQQARTLVWVSPALDELRKWAEIDGAGSSGPLFPSPLDSRKPMVGLQKYWDKVRQQAGVNMRWHDWRHQCGTYLAMQGANAFLIAEILGHSSMRTTRRYTHLTTESKRQALEAAFGIGPRELTG